MFRRHSLLGLVPMVFFALMPAAQGEGPLNLYFIDVQGGAATLLVTPERESILIDSGWAGFDDRDPKRIEHVVRDVVKLDHIDHLITTHWHADHYGGVEGLAKRMPIGRYWDRGLPDLSASDGDRANYPDGPSATDPLGIAYRKASAGKRTALKAGDVLKLRGSIQAAVMASGGQIYATKAGPGNNACDDAPADQAPDPSDNARSLAIRFRLGQFDFLDCGDLTWNVEKKLVCPVDQIGPIDLFQVTHHGAANSNHPTFLRTIAPTVAVMNNGPRKGGDASVVALLKSLPTVRALYQLHKNAATPADSNTSPALIANADPAGGQFIHVSVTPDGARFDVEIGTGGKSASFDSR